MALQIINKCLSDAVCAMARNMLDGESRATALIHSGNEILEAAIYSSEARLFPPYPSTLLVLVLFQPVIICLVETLLAAFKTRISFQSNKLY